MVTFVYENLLKLNSYECKRTLQNLNFIKMTATVAFFNIKMLKKKKLDQIFVRQQESLGWCLYETHWNSASALNHEVIA